MCRLLGYLGRPILLDYVLDKPEHSLIVQSYQPREMTSGVVNADGYGMGWYHTQKETEPFIYKNLLPIWGDINLPNLGRYIESGCILANIRSATVGQVVDLSNCQPFRHQGLLFTHNGAIQNFRKTLQRPIRDRLNDTAYQSIEGTTDSEHIFALLINQWMTNSSMPLEEALCATLETLEELAESYETGFSANLLLTDGKRMVACRYAYQVAVPSLYWLKDDPMFPDAVIIASEPLCVGDWISFTENSVVSVGQDLDIKIHQL